MQFVYMRICVQHAAEFVHNITVSCGVYFTCVSICFTMHGYIRIRGANEVFLVDRCANSFMESVHSIDA